MADPFHRRAALFRGSLHVLCIRAQCRLRISFAAVLSARAASVRGRPRRACSLLRLTPRPAQFITSWIVHAFIRDSSAPPPSAVAVTVVRRRSAPRACARTHRRDPEHRRRSRSDRRHRARRRRDPSRSRLLERRRQPRLPARLSVVPCGLRLSRRAAGRQRRAHRGRAGGRRAFTDAPSRRRRARTRRTYERLPSPESDRLRLSG